jgi:SAM-dependent methyltransferase
MHSGNKTTVSSYYEESVRLGTEFQEQNKSWAGYDVVKYQKQIKDLVDRYGAKTILDYGCGKGLQYQEKLPYGGGAGVELPQDQWQTFDEYLGVTVYKYDPCVAGFEQLPPEGTKFDGVICTQVLNSIPDDDLPWVRDLLESYSSKFCFVGLNFQREAKSKKTMYDPEYFRQPRTREFFRSYFTNWSGSDLFWWWKDRMHYTEWASDQLNGTWKDVPDTFEGKYQFTEAIYR